MRETKFKAWNKENGGWINMADWPFITFEGELGLINMPSKEVSMLDTELFEIVQYTGLKDKNGKKIYKGDIIRDKYGIGAVEWNDGIGAWSWPKGEDWGMIFTDTVEVIGNLYENPELLEKQIP